MEESVCMPDSLTPHSVFNYFKQICKIPRGSGNCGAIADMLVSFAKHNNLECFRDKHDNVIIIKEASMGKEGLKPVILQGHTDMVCEKIPDYDFDFLKNGIELNFDGDYITANNTTLGADNGIAVAFMLAILSDVTLSLPRIEAVFTSDEEIGMIGAMHLDVSPLKGRRMINLDCDKEGEFIIGCAGGVVSDCVIPVKREAYDGDAYQITVSGLKGGHSGEKIDCGRANADILLVRLLQQISKEIDFRLISIDGGLKDNAIPSKAYAKIISSDYNIIRNNVVKFQNDICNEFRLTEPDVRIELSQCEYSKPMDSFSMSNVLDFLILAPNGVQDMSKNIEGLVETSLNLGILSTDIDSVSVSYCVRSSIESKKNLVCEKLSKLCNLYGGSFSVEGNYPAWEFYNNSELVSIFENTYQNMFKSKPKILTIHAGLECGVFVSKIPGLDCISIGPDLDEIHTPYERMNVLSVKRTWDMLINILTNIK